MKSSSQIDWNLPEILYLGSVLLVLGGCVALGQWFSWVFITFYLVACGVEIFRCFTKHHSCLPWGWIWIYRGAILAIAGVFLLVFHSNAMWERKRVILTPGSFCRELLGVTKEETFSLRSLGVRKLDSFHPLRSSAGIEWTCSSTNSPPNLLVILVDTLRADALSCYHANIKPLPAFDRIAAQGVLFERAYSTTNWTRGAVATLMTGLYPTEHGITTYDFSLAPESHTLAEILRTNGYHTAAFMTNAMVSAEYGFDQGFDVFYEAYRQLDKEPSSNAALYDSSPEISMAFKGGNSLTHFPIGYTRSLPRFEQLFSPIDQWLQERPQNPFFCYIHTVDPHDPYAPPAAFLEAMTKRVPELALPNDLLLESYVDGEIIPSATDIIRLRALYQAEVEYTDNCLNRLLQRLEQAGALENTLCVLLSDHGEEFFEHQRFLHGWTLHEDQVRIPLLFWGSSSWQPGQRIAQPISLIDLFPTLLAAVGIQPVAISALPGQSWLDFRGHWRIPKDNRPIILESDYNYTSSRAVIEDSFKLFYLPKASRKNNMNNSICAVAKCNSNRREICVVASAGWPIPYPKP